jgi:hypothetical protein
VNDQGDHLNELQERFDRLASNPDMVGRLLTNIVFDLDTTMGQVDRLRGWLTCLNVAVFMLTVALASLLFNWPTAPAPADAVDRTAALILESDQLTHDQQRAAIDALAVVLGELRDGGAE